MSVTVERYFWRILPIWREKKTPCRRLFLHPVTCTHLIETDCLLEVLLSVDVPAAGVQPRLLHHGHLQHWLQGAIPDISVNI